MLSCGLHILSYTYAESPFLDLSGQIFITYHRCVIEKEHAYDSLNTCSQILAFLTHSFPVSFSI